MPAPRFQPAEDDDTSSFSVTWGEIIADWDTVEADLYATYGTVPDTVEDWPRYRRMILGLMSRPTSVFANRKMDTKRKTAN